MANTGKIRYLTYLKVSDDGNETPLDKNNIPTSISGLPQDVKVMEYGSDDEGWEIDFDKCPPADKIVIPTDPDGEVPSGYVRLTFDAKEGNIGGKKKYLVDVLKSTKFNDNDLQEVVKSIKPTYIDETKEFDKWNPPFPNTNTDVTTSTYNALYVDLLDDIIPISPDETDLPDGFVKLLFKAGDGGTLSGIGESGDQVTGVSQLAYAVRDTLTWSEISSLIPTPTPNESYEIVGWKPSLGSGSTLVDAGTYTHEFEVTTPELDDIIPADPDNLETPDGYTCVLFTTTTTIIKYVSRFPGGPRTEIKVKAYNVKNTLDWSDSEVRAIIPPAIQTDRFLTLDYSWDRDIPNNGTVEKSECWEFNRTYTKKIHRVFEATGVKKCSSTENSFTESSTGRYGFKELKDVNPYSYSYNQSEWSRDTSYDNQCYQPDTSPKWEETGKQGCSSSNSSYTPSETGRYGFKQLQDMNTESDSYNHTKWVRDTSYDNQCYQPDTSPKWEETGLYSCSISNSDIKPNDTGSFRIEEQVDTNPESDSYSEIRWVPVDTNGGECYKGDMYRFSSTKNNVTFVCDGGTETATITSTKNDSFHEYEIESKPAWLNVTKNRNILTIKANKNQ